MTVDVYLSVRFSENIANSFSKSSLPCNTTANIYTIGVYAVYMQVYLLVSELFSSCFSVSVSQTRDNRQIILFDLD